MIHKQTTAMSMTTTNTNTNTNTNANAPVAAADDCDCDTAYATSADLRAPYITLEEARKERQEERKKQWHEQWDDCLIYAQHYEHKRGRLAKKEETVAVKAAAMYALLSSSLASYFMPDEETEVTW
jgi:hypothetical protein